jgi:hypothetical protein
MRRRRRHAAQHSTSKASQNKKSVGEVQMLPLDTGVAAV